MDVTYDFSDVGTFLLEAESSIEERLEKVGEEAVAYAKENGTYQNRTGNLRRSNKYEVEEDGLLLLNDAHYASNVEQKGYDVLSGAALFAERRLREEFGI